ncbi:MAG: cob(I)yrinic acid a,c-diamide adenosyltransferase [Candidatus Zixiibacteriota bacterium]|nr:MAG: cob(I)yrinic acid a,c-diamide adenosyltransferase [candidate division Zixibacteria bacterium]
MNLLHRGYVHVYTGDGKGKTTAALGLALRAAGAGLTVTLIQFMKGQPYSEIVALERFAPQIQVMQTGRTKCIRREEVAEDDRAEAQRGLDRARQILAGSERDLLILDEILVAHWFGLVTSDDLLGLMEMRPPQVELILTGRKAPPEVMARADLVTEMLEIKHYYKTGVPARRGIES